MSSTRAYAAFSSTPNESALSSRASQSTKRHAQFLAVCSRPKWSRHPDKITRPRSARDGRVQRRIQDALSLLERIELPKVAQELKEAQVARKGRLADAAKHPQVGLEQREQTLRPIFMDVPPRGFLLGVIDEVMRIALERRIAAGRVRLQP